MMPQKKAATCSLFLAFAVRFGIKNGIDAILDSSIPTGKAKLLDRVREVARFKHYSLRTERTYADWIRQFILYHGKRHPETMGAEEVRDFLTHLAVARHVAASTQNQAFSALLFLYREVLKQDLPWIGDVERVRRPPKLPVVFTREEARAVLEQMRGTARLMAQLLYGCGLRLSECARLRIHPVRYIL
jgi:integrase